MHCYKTFLTKVKTNLFHYVASVLALRVLAAAPSLASEDGDTRAKCWVAGAGHNHSVPPLMTGC